MSDEVFLLIIANRMKPYPLQMYANEYPFNVEFGCKPVVTKFLDFKYICSYQQRQFRY